MSDQRTRALERQAQATGSAPHDVPDPGGRAIRAAEAWLADPSEENKGRCADVVGRDLNADHQGLAVCEAIASGVDVYTLCSMEIGDAAEVAGQQAVHDAIRAALVPWALGVA